MAIKQCQMAGGVKMLLINKESLNSVKSVEIFGKQSALVTYVDGSSEKISGGKNTGSDLISVFNTKKWSTKEIDPKDAKPSTVYFGSDALVHSFTPTSSPRQYTSLGDDVKNSKLYALVLMSLIISSSPEDTIRGIDCELFNKECGPDIRSALKMYCAVGDQLGIDVNAMEDKFDNAVEIMKSKIKQCQMQEAAKADVKKKIEKEIDDVKF